MDIATAPVVDPQARETTPRRIRANERLPKVHFGGPDRQPRLLRDLLEERIDAVGPGGSIDWMTYYFRDGRLADALVRAHRRGVNVRLCLEGKPRLDIANERVIEHLRDPKYGIGSGLQVVKHLLPLHLHSKIYCFSEPRPTALVGSFNPSANGDEPEWMIEEIGDQDRGHNHLVELIDPELVSSLARRVAALHSSRGRFSYARGATDGMIVHDELEAVFFPLLARSPLISRLGDLPSGSSLRIAASHVRDPFIVRELGRLVKRGVEVTVLTGDTMRRTPRRTERYLLEHGVKVLRFTHRDGLPMHAKFILAELPKARWCAFGSYNLTLTSRWLNHELLVFSTDPRLWDSFDWRWQEIEPVSR
jgi:hypothetical protein